MGGLDHVLQGQHEKSFRWPRSVRSRHDTHGAG